MTDFKVPDKAVLADIVAALNERFKVTREYVYQHYETKPGWCDCAQCRAYRVALRDNAAYSLETITCPNYRDYPYCETHNRWFHPWDIDDDPDRPSGCIECRQNHPNYLKTQKEIDLTARRASDKVVREHDPARTPAFTNYVLNPDSFRAKKAPKLILVDEIGLPHEICPKCQSLPCACKENNPGPPTI